MLRLGLDRAALESSFTILAIGAHADDIEIGCAGTMLRLAELAPHAHVHWLVLSGNGERRAEAEASAAELLGSFAASTVAIEAFRDGYFPHGGAAIKDVFEALKTVVSPDLVLTHQRADLHQDHRLVCELTWNTFRNHLILEYEVPKWDGDLGSPNVFVQLSHEQAARKIDLLRTHFPSQAGKAWFAEDVFRAMLHLRGMESNAPSLLAEAFYGRKLAL